MTTKTPSTDPNSTASLQRDAPLEHLRTVFVGFFQGLFAASERGLYHWTEDDETSEIFITDENTVKVEKANQRPAISFTRGPIKFHSLGLDDMMEFDQRTGSKTKSVLIPGTMVINSSSRVALESERIAFICAEQLWLHRELLMQEGFFEVGRQPEIGSPSPPGSIIAGDGADEWYVTSVLCPFQFYRTSAVTPLGKQRLAALNVSLRSRIRLVQEQYVGPGGHCGPLENAGVEVPVGIKACRPPALVPEASDIYGNTPNPGSAPPELRVVPHPLNPSQLVTIRGIRPHCPAVRPPSMGGRAIPIPTVYVEESCESPTDVSVTTRTFKV